MSYGTAAKRVSVAAKDDRDPRLCLADGCPNVGVYSQSTMGGRMICRDHWGRPEYEWPAITAKLNAGK